MRFLDIYISNDMNYSPLNENIFDSKIWKKDCQEDKEESSIFTEKKDISKNKVNNKQNKNNKKSKNSSLNSNTNSNSNNSDNNNSSSGNNNNNNINKQKNNNIFQKKLTLPISSIPYSLKMKKEFNKNINNNNNNKNLKKPFGQKGILHNSKGKEQNTNLLGKIIDKVNKERKIVNKNIIKEKLELKNKTKTKENNNKSKSTNKEIKKETKETNNNNCLNKIQTNNIKEKIKDDDNDGFGKEEEFQNDDDNEILQINKVQSIDIKPNFMNNNYFQPTNPYYSFSNNSNNNSNKSLTKQKCYTESDDSYNKSNLYDPPSGRSNNSNNTFLTTNSYQGNKSASNYPFSGLLQFDNPLNINNNLNNNTLFYPRKNMALMGSFLSTGANSNSHSGKRFDTSNSNESGQSPHNFNVLQRQFSNNNLNNNYIMQIKPLETYPHNNFSSNELAFKQPFSLNTSFYYKKSNKNKFYSNNNEPKEKQIINLENIALGIEKRTTVMIRNIPIKYTIKVMEKELEYFVGKFDCLYIPYDYENGGNKGYAFLNLINPYHVLLFYEVFQGKCWSFFDSKKMCELNFANFQGIHEIKKHAKNYKGLKQPTFYNNVNYDSNNKNIEVPRKYLKLILDKNPNLKYYENKMLNTVIITSFN